MATIVQMSSWRSNHDIHVCIWVKSLDNLMSIADMYGEPAVFQKGKKEYAFVHNGTIYRYDGE